MAVLGWPIHPCHTHARLPDPCLPRSPGCPALPLPSLGLPWLLPQARLGPEDWLSRRVARRLGKEPSTSQQNDLRDWPFPSVRLARRINSKGAPDTTWDLHPFSDQQLLCLSSHEYCHQTLTGPVPV